MGINGVLPNESNGKTTAIPLLQRRGGRDLKKISPKAPLIGADGVVRNVFDHLVCASKVASQLSLDRAATPPLEEGNSSIPAGFNAFGQNTRKPIPTF
jgi:hypothetical protein